MKLMENHFDTLPPNVLSNILSLVTLSLLCQHLILVGTVRYRWQDARGG